MSLVINTNMMSLNAQRNLNMTQNALAQSLERLSSGLRINSAKDDAAGLAISERFTSQINGLNQAVRNANDGISLAQTAEGALDTVTDLLQRARQLSVQAANDSNSAADRQALNDEVRQLMTEAGRIANNTEYNGRRILDGSAGDLFFQVGANQGQMITISGVDARSARLGVTEVAGTGGLARDQLLTEFATVGAITIDGAGFDSIEIAASEGGMLEDVVRRIDSAIAERAGGGDADAAAVARADLRASLRVDDDGNTTIAVTGRLGTQGLSVSGGEIDLDGDGVDSELFATAVSEDITLNAVEVTTREAATRAMGALEGALDQVNSLRSRLGAVQTRFESTISKLEIGAENLSSARSRIMDADFAAEAAALTRALVLQQAGIAVLLRANAMPQNLLALLR
ncbi:flagellin [Thioalkalivibrio sp. ALgr3]|uniref:flagellin N-terminal helical domain-containing protein n=1 Tax=Thioalkalivibrio sp. ALgr3 TaxID=1239292 RepID=UPI00036CC220|nr:flagellin [Thioalkalivibrio sp. ALgr3]